MNTFWFLVLTIISLLIFISYMKKQGKKKELLIDTYKFPDNINRVLKEVYPYLNENDLEKVNLGLREYFKLYIFSSRRIIVMPSRVIDRAWYEFMCHTEEYQKFCDEVFGFFLPQAPIKGVVNNEVENDLKMAWTLACDKDEINADKPEKLPLIFALDRILNIEDGFKYSIDNDESNNCFDATKIGSLRFYYGRS